MTFNVQDQGTYRAATLYVCGKCGRTADDQHVREWLIARRVDTAEAQAEGWMVIRCPAHITEYARRIAGLPQRPRRGQRPDYAQYVHEYTDDQGRTRYAVARWDEEHAQYIRPLDAAERRLTGCSAEFARTLTHNDIQNYSDRKRALTRARYLFRPQLG
jgi:DNA-directed RNA polymerase subunit RPC12/RpoP